ncbi:MAG: 3'-5' exonuclease, partial [Candidatus Fermentibacterota bacterium]
MKLSELPLLVVDVQTTGASPLGAGLLEVGWQRLGPHGGGAVSLPCRLPPGVPLPPRIRRITGIGDEDRTGREATPREIWWLLSAAGGGGPVPQVPLLAHYALFERRWLRHMAALAGVEWEPDVICTMELARRVFPGLPGKGLRSVAGYLGFSLSRHRRAADHLRATAFVWGRMLPLLAEEGVETLGELRRFLKAPPTGGRRLTALDRRRLSRLPRRPGVYRLLAADGRVL